MDDKPSRAWTAYLVGMMGLFAVALLALVLLTPRAHAEPQCAPWKEMKAALEKDFHETPTGAGLVNEQGIVVLYESADGKTWTLLAVGADGKACIISGGTAWSQAAPPKPPVKGERAS